MGISKVEFSDNKQTSEDIPSELTLSTSGSFAKSEPSVTSPTKSSSTEGAITPSIEEKSKTSEIVLDPCTLAQGYEDLSQKGKTGSKPAISSPDEKPQQPNAPNADDNLNTSHQD